MVQLKDARQFVIGAPDESAGDHISTVNVSIYSVSKQKGAE